MSSKIWIENDMYLVDEEVYNYIELLETKIWVEGNPRINVIRQHHLDQLQAENEELKAKIWVAVNPMQREEL